ncbi:MAG TPA: HD domain-containing protein [Thermomicrobiales bacterium]|nr:HD domain-containing protein [Thermomicrobiales bacterium]
MANQQTETNIMPQSGNVDIASDEVLDALGDDLRIGKTDVSPETAAAATRTESSLSFETVKNDPEVQAYIKQANKNLGVLGFTEHGFRHVGLVANIARNVMRLLDYDPRQQELAAIAGYLHDIGNVVSRHGHATTGALLAYPILNRLGMAPEDVAIVLGAIGSHGDDHGRLGEPVHPVSASLILADKSDVHRSRVRNTDPATFDQHDRVNYAATSSFLRVSPEVMTITLELTIDTEMAPVMQYFEIFLPRMLMSRHAAELLNCVFHITINEVVVL